MSFQSIAKTISTSDTTIYQMPAYTKTKFGKLAIQPRTGSIRLSIYNSGGSIENVVVKIKTIFDLEPKEYTTVEVSAGSYVTLPLPIGLGPGDFVTGATDTADTVTVSGSISGYNILPETRSGEIIYEPFVLRRPIDHAIAWAVASQTFGAGGPGGFYMGVIDTVAGTIDSADAYQTGDRYALLVSPKDLERGSGLKWCAKSTDAVIAGALTRWNGLEATNTLIGLNDSDYEVADYIEGLRSTDAPPATEGGSDIYLPAFDELELLYRNGKPNGEDNRTDGQNAKGGAFPSSTSTHGTNPSSDPTGSGYTNNPRNPDESPLAAFMEGGSQVLSESIYWTATDADGGATQGRAWLQYFAISGNEGRQRANRKDLANYSVRPVRHISLT